MKTITCLEKRDYVSPKITVYDLKPEMAILAASGTGNESFGEEQGGW